MVDTIHDTDGGLPRTPCSNKRNLSKSSTDVNKNKKYSLHLIDLPSWIPMTPVTVYHIQYIH
jgi:hypothetical protein